MSRKWKENLNRVKRFKQLRHKFLFTSIPYLIKCYTNVILLMLEQQNNENEKI